MSLGQDSKDAKRKQAEQKKGQYDAHLGSQHEVQMNAAHNALMAKLKEHKPVPGDVKDYEAALDALESKHQEYELLVQKSANALKAFREVALGRPQEAKTAIAGFGRLQERLLRESKSAQSAYADSVKELKAKFNIPDAQMAPVSAQLDIMQKAQERQAAFLTAERTKNQPLLSEAHFTEALSRKLSTTFMTQHLEPNSGTPFYKRNKNLANQAGKKTIHNPEEYLIAPVDQASSGFQPGVSGVQLDDLDLGIRHWECKTIPDVRLATFPRTVATFNFSKDANGAFTAATTISGNGKMSKNAATHAYMVLIQGLHAAGSSSINFKNLEKTLFHRGRPWDSVDKDRIKDILREAAKKFHPDKIAIEGVSLKASAYGDIYEECVAIHEDYKKSLSKAKVTPTTVKEALTITIPPSAQARQDYLAASTSAREALIPELSTEDRAILLKDSPSEQTIRELFIDDQKGLTPDEQINVRAAMLSTSTRNGLLLAPQTIVDLLSRLPDATRSSVLTKMSTEARGAYWARKIETATPAQQTVIFTQDIGIDATLKLQVLKLITNPVVLQNLIATMPHKEAVKLLTQIIKESTQPVEGKHSPITTIAAMTSANDPEYGKQLLLDCAQDAEVAKRILSFTHMSADILRSVLWASGFVAHVLTDDQRTDVMQNWLRNGMDAATLAYIIDGYPEPLVGNRADKMKEIVQKVCNPDGKPGNSPEANLVIEVNKQLEQRANQKAQTASIEQVRSTAANYDPNQAALHRVIFELNNNFAKTKNLEAKEDKDAASLHFHGTGTVKMDKALAELKANVDKQEAKSQKAHMAAGKPAAAADTDMTAQRYTSLAPTEADPAVIQAEGKRCAQILLKQSVAMQVDVLRNASANTDPKANFDCKLDYAAAARLQYLRAQVGKSPPVTPTVVMFSDHRATINHLQRHAIIAEYKPQQLANVLNVPEAKGMSSPGQLLDGERAAIFAAAPEALQLQVFPLLTPENQIKLLTTDPRLVAANGTTTNWDDATRAAYIAHTRDPIALLQDPALATALATVGVVNTDTIVAHLMANTQTPPGNRLTPAQKAQLIKAAYIGVPPQPPNTTPARLLLKHLADQNTAAALTEGTKILLELDALGLNGAVIAQIMGTTPNTDKLYNYNVLKDFVLNADVEKAKAFLTNNAQVRATVVEMLCDDTLGNKGKNRARDLFSEYPDLDQKACLGADITRTPGPDSKMSLLAQANVFSVVEDKKRCETIIQAVVNDDFKALGGDARKVSCLVGMITDTHVPKNVSQANEEKHLAERREMIFGEVKNIDAGIQTAVFARLAQHTNPHYYIEAFKGLDGNPNLLKGLKAQGATGVARIAALLSAFDISVQTNAAKVATVFAAIKTNADGNHVDWKALLASSKLKPDIRAAIIGNVTIFPANEEVNLRAALEAVANPKEAQDIFHNKLTPDQRTNLTAHIKATITENGAFGDAATKDRWNKILAPIPEAQAEEKQNPSP